MAFPFLDLPAEIRINIYRLLLVKDARFKLHNFYEMQASGRHTLDTTLLCACQQIALEGAATLYGENSFYIFDFAFLQDLLAKMGTYNAGLIRKVCLHTNFFNRGRRVASNKHIVEMLAQIPGLQNVVIEKGQMWTQRTGAREGAIKLAAAAVKKTNLKVAIETQKGMVYWSSTGIIPPSNPEADEDARLYRMTLVANEKVEPGPNEAILDLRQELAKIKAQKKKRATNKA